MNGVPYLTEIASLIDHTILKADATRQDVLKVCAEAREYGFASVCVNPYWVPLVARRRLSARRVLNRIEGL
jgi:deoxyribose-phosphate aldolase